MADKALADAASSWGPVHYMIRSRLYKGLCAGGMKVASLLPDEREKIEAGACCAYCGEVNGLGMDHILPRARGGTDRAENLVPACRRCNSSKGSKDLLEWFQGQGHFPPLAILRRYLKMAMAHAEAEGLMARVAAEVSPDEWPYTVSALPGRPPKPSQLIWVHRRG